MLSVTILGNNSAVPAFNRHPTSQVVTQDGTSYLVDCGEGTQIQMIKYKVRRGKISHIFISHVHGAQPLQQIIEMQLKVADTHLPYPLYFHAITENATLVDNDKILIKCFRTNHRIECYGFSFEEKEGKRKLLIEKVKKHRIPQ